jgi:hypothetical protein
VHTLGSVTSLIEAAAESDESLAKTLTGSNSRVLGNLRKFLQVLLDSKVRLRVVVPDKDFCLTEQQIAQAFDRVSSTDTSEETISRYGTFRGVTLDSSRFDFQTDGGEHISGSLAQEVPEDQASAWAALTNKAAKATLRVTSITTKSGVPRKKHELVDLQSVN